MLVELGGGTKPHPRADVVIDLRHPFNAPAQDATYCSVAGAAMWQVNADVPGARHVTTIVDCDGWRNPVHRLADECVDEVFCSHFMEHVPKGQATIAVMNEAWRILKPGGTFTMILPLVGYTHRDGVGHLVAGWQPYADPTHVQGWWLPESLHYFTGQIAADADYGIRQWAPLTQQLSEQDASLQLSTGQHVMHSRMSWWAVRGGWEGCAQLVKEDTRAR